MAEARDATIGGAGVGGAAAAATDDEWDIHDRLKNLLSMFATSDHSCKYFGRSFFLFFFCLSPRHFYLASTSVILCLFRLL
jgi:hypothetical protein